MAHDAGSQSSDNTRKEQVNQVEDGTFNGNKELVNNSFDGEKQGEPLERHNTVQNEMNLSFIMTMLGFSMTFVCSEVIPLFMITLFTIIAQDFDAAKEVIWLIVSQFIAVGAIVPFVGPLADLIGRKNITLISLILTMVSMIIIGLTKTYAGILVGQVLSGIAIGIQLLTSIAAVTELVPISKRGLTIGYIVIGFLPFAPAPVYGQLMAEKNWRWFTLLIGLLAAVAFVLLLIFYHPPPRVNSLGLTNRQKLQRMDFVGGFLSISGVTVFLVGLNWGGQTYAWNDKHVVATLTVGLGLLVIFGIWEKWGTKYPMFPARLAQHPRMFVAVLLLCLTSGVNFIPVVVFWVVQCYTVYGATYRQAGIYLLPIGFCIAGGAMISAGLMTAFPKKIHLLLIFFCVMQTAGLGCMAIIDPENINSAWGPMVVGLIGVGGVLLPSQVVFSIISPDDLIGTSVALSIVVRATGQVIGVSMFYNLFYNKSYETTLRVFLPYAIRGGLGFDQKKIEDVVLAFTSGPFQEVSRFFPYVKTQAQVDALVQGSHAVYKESFPIMYFVSIAFGGFAILCCLALTGIHRYINDHVSVNLAH